MANRMAFDEVLGMRELFWRNVMREILTSLSVASLSRAGNEESEKLFDGRMAILTHGGERIPIADVYPLFACGIPSPDRDRALSMAVECSVFQIRTPGGEVYTLPLQEMRAFHAVSSELMEELTDRSTKALEEGGTEEPFGFAAFTSLAQETKGAQEG